MDTSVWIDYLEGYDTEASRRLGELIESGVSFGITSHIYQEVLQGVESQREFDEVDRHLGNQRFYHPENEVESYREAARVYFDCRRAGVTIRSAIDCLIARVAIENDLVLLHDDRDFARINGVLPELRLA